MNYTNTDFQLAEMKRDVSSMQSVSVAEGEPLYKYLSAYIPNNLVEGGPNLSLKLLPANAEAIESNHRLVDGRILYQMGIGEYAFRTFDGETLYALHHYVGKPVGTDCGAKVLKHMVLFTVNGLSHLSAFLNKLVALMETSEVDKFICYTWKIRYRYWDEESKVNKRPIDSVVLPKAVKDRMINDLTKFLLPKTKEFYLRNGIPYRRSYLFYGTPGTGKTSMVQALAAHFGRNVCFLLPTHPEMNDDSLRAAVNSIPANSIVVFEDIDSLFAKDRSSQMNKNSLTFSGLLNALDGIGSSNGQVFVLTTNLRENLDNALIRNGRVDLHFEFTYAVAEQMELMWRNFYPDAHHLDVAFSSAVVAQLNERGLQVTTAGLQHFFVTQMESTAEEALANVGEIVEGILQNSSNDMLKDAKKETKQKKNKGKKNRKGNAIEATVTEATKNEVLLPAPVIVSSENSVSASASTTPTPEVESAPEEEKKIKSEKRKERRLRQRQRVRKEKKEAEKTKVEVDGDETSAVATVDAGEE